MTWHSTPHRGTAPRLRRPERRPWGPVLVGAGLAAAFLTLGWVSQRYGGADGIVLAEHLPSPRYFALATFGAGATGLLMAHGRRRAAASAALLTTAALLLLGLAGNSLGPSVHEGVYRNPDASLELRVTSAPPQAPAGQRLRVQQNDGPLSHYWEVGCLPGGDERLETVRWAAVDQVVLTVDGHPEVVRVTDGRPDHRPGTLTAC